MTATAANTTLPSGATATTTSSSSSCAGNDDHSNNNTNSTILPTTDAAATNNNNNSNNNGGNHDNDDEKEIRALLSLDPSYCTNELYKTMHLTDVTILNISNTGISDYLPDSISTLLPNLQILFCSNNNFDSMPLVIGQCPKLSMIAFKSCGMTYIPPECLQVQLRWLILTDNRLAEIPTSIGNCTKLQKVALSGNLLQNLPSTIRYCTNLELIRLASNQFHVPPLDLLSLPNLKWIALSDNPFVNDYIVTKTTSSEGTNFELPTIPGIPDDVGIVLGQGAGGITRKVRRMMIKEEDGCDENKEDKEDVVYVAVKQYPTTVEITTDGKPQQEMFINSYIGKILQKESKHCNNNSNNNNCPDPKYKGFVQVLGKTETGGALIMEYLERFVPMAKPPDFETCTRCVYENSVGLTLLRNLSYEQSISIVTDLINTLTVLHAEMNIIHGDLFGHNILIQQQQPPDTNNSSNSYSNNHTTNVRVSDFGAAFMYDPSTEYGKLLQQIEIRAFYVLVDEINHHALSRIRNEVEDKEGDSKMEETDSSSSSIICQLINNKSSLKTFQDIQIYWNQLKLQDIAKAFDVNDDTE